jgi:hypothetical protein
LSRLFRGVRNDETSSETQNDRGAADWRREQAVISVSAWNAPPQNRSLGTAK